MPLLLAPDGDPVADSKSRRPPGGVGQSLVRHRLYSRVRDRAPEGISRAELNQHFQGMPGRYWERVTKTELIWGLEMVHAFSQRVGASPGSKGVVAADARHYPERGFTKVMLCCWDRPGLLAKIAAAFSALRVSILRAEVYTRRDGIALDLFEVADLNDRLPYLIFLLEGALNDPPRFVSVWASEFHKLVPQSGPRLLRVQFDNDYSSEHTLVRVETKDRLGLLHDLLQALTNCGLDIAQATVETVDDVASDVFHVSEIGRGKITSANRLEQIRKGLIQAVSE